MEDIDLGDIPVMLVDGGGVKSPERALLAYLVADAVERWREGKKEAARWLFEPASGIGSFDWCCRHLSLDAQMFRSKLLENKTRISFYGISVSKIFRE